MQWKLLIGFPWWQLVPPCATTLRGRPWGERCCQSCRCVLVLGRTLAIPVPSAGQSGLLRGSAEKYHHVALLKLACQNLPRTAQCFEDDSLDNLTGLFLTFLTSLWNFNWCDRPCVYITGQQISFWPVKETPLLEPAGQVYAACQGSPPQVQFANGAETLQTSFVARKLFKNWMINRKVSGLWCEKSGNK